MEARRRKQVKTLQVPHTHYPWPSKPKSTWSTWIGPPNTVHAVFGDPRFLTRWGLNNPGHFTFISMTAKCFINPSCAFQNVSKGHGSGIGIPMLDTPLEPKCGTNWRSPTNGQIWIWLGNNAKRSRVSAKFVKLPNAPAPPKDPPVYSHPRPNHGKCGVGLVSSAPSCS